MSKFTLHKFLSFSVLSMLLLSSCKDDTYLATPPPVADISSFTENFDTTSAALARGWKIYNKSAPSGSSVWQDGGGIPAFFNSYSNNGSNVGFIGVDYLSTSAGQGIISQWLISPSILMQDGDKIVFYTRAQKSPGYIDDNPGDSTDFANRMQLLVNTLGDRADTLGQGDNTGSFSASTDPVIDINPNYYEWHNTPGDYPLDGGPSSTPETIAKAYPVEWTRFETSIHGLGKPTMGKFAFRYYVQNGGSAGRGTGIGIDQVTYTSISKK